MATFKTLKAIHAGELIESDKYHVYTDGRIYSTKRNRFLAERKVKSRYKKVFIQNKMISIHRVIATTFEVGDLTKRDATVNHINGDKHDNRLENIEVLSQADNIRHGKQFVKPPIYTEKEINRRREAAKKQWKQGNIGRKRISKPQKE